MNKVVLATRNAGKIVELRRILAEAGVPLELVGLEAFPHIGDVAETGLTFAENSLLKAHAVASESGLPAIADDSGLCVDALGGAPGIFSARYAEGGDQARCEKLLEALKDVPAGRRGAHYVCAAVLAHPDGREESAVGTCEGHIALAARGTGGFGYDPVFQLSDGRTMAELAAAEKEALSHRGQALRALAPKLSGMLAC
jgi:XTP/dITP diphosphohydrolase